MGAARTQVRALDALEELIDRSDSLREGLAGLRDTDDRLERWEGRPDGGELLEAREPPASVQVTIRHQQNLGLDLAESVDDPAHAEIGGGGGEDGPDRRRGKKRDDGFGDVRHPGGNPVSRPDAGGAQPGREGSHLLPQFGPGDLLW